MRFEDVNQNKELRNSSGGRNKFLISHDLIFTLKKNYPLDWNGTHGIRHWLRVWENGRYLSEKTGANKKVVDLFAMFHDCKRKNEYSDPNHGERGAKLASRLRKKIFTLGDNDFELLRIACMEHTGSISNPDVTIQTCFDADRLDLGRVGKKPDPKFLNSAAAKDQDVIEWAYKRSIMDTVPEDIPHEWLNPVCL